jgi:Tol biopolymer transport system component
VSPDQKWIAFYTFEEAAGQWKVAVMPFAGGEPIKLFDIPTASRLQWQPDSKGLMYVNDRNGVSNLWSQPLDGGPRKQATNFANGVIFNYAWSQDGKQLFLVRGSVTSDVILISNAK